MFLPEDQSKLKKIITACRYEDGSEIDFSALYATIISSSSKVNSTLYSFIINKLRLLEFSPDKDSGKINLLCLAAILHELEKIDLRIYYYEGAVKTELKSCGLHHKALPYYGALKEEFIAAKYKNSLGDLAQRASDGVVEAARYVFLAAAPIANSVAGNAASLFGSAKQLFAGAAEKNTGEKKPENYGTL